MSGSGASSAVGGKPHPVNCGESTGGSTVKGANAANGVSVPLTVRSRRYYDEAIRKGLQPDFASFVAELMMRLCEAGYQPRIASGRRSKEEQAEKVRLGYSRTMRSKHLVGLAADIVDKRWGWSKQGEEFFKRLGVEAKRLGLIWGGDWRFKDVAHVEMKRCMTR